ncbi:MAG: hypothetical protein AB1938_24960 [Myxococcota bacterium]
MRLGQAVVMGATAGFLLGAFGGCGPSGPPCTPDTCDGCCDEAEVCHPGNEATYCGLEGRACVSCAPSTCRADGTCFGAYQPLDAGDEPIEQNLYEPDGAVDGGDSDAGGTDAGPVDAGDADAGEADAGVDAGGGDAGVDAGAMDAGDVDAGEVDAGPPDAGPSDGGAPDAGVVDAGAPDAGPGGLFVSPTGDDSNPGTAALPLRTLNRAASLAVDGGWGDTIWLQDGTYTSATQPNFAASGPATVVPPGLSVRAVNPGQVTLVGNQGGALSLSGDGVVEGLAFDNFSVALSVSAGAVAVRGCSFIRSGGGADGTWGALTLSGSADVTVTPRAGVPLTFAPSKTFARVNPGARLHVLGGELNGGQPQIVSASAFINVFGGEVVLENVLASGHLDRFLNLSGPSVATVRDSQFRMNATSNLFIITGGGATPGQLTLENVVVVETPFPLTAPTGGNQHAVVSARNVAFLDGGNGYGITTGFGATLDLILDGVLIDGFGYGLSVGHAGSTDVQRTAIRARTIGLSGSAGVAGSRLSVRNTTITGASQAGLLLQYAVPATIDLGTGADAGNNDFAGNGHVTFGPNLWVNDVAAGTTVFAVGNRWNAGAQGADADGGYTSTDGGSYELVGPRSGRNVSIDQAGDRVRLAEP